MSSGSGFGEIYKPVVPTVENVMALVPPEAGLCIAGIGKIRPYEACMQAGETRFRAIDEDGSFLTVSVDELPGFQQTTDGPSGLPCVSFRYYKAGADETRFRNVVPAASINFGFGVHVDHAGQRPALYLHGVHYGNSAIGPDGDPLPNQTLQDRGVRNFSLACIIGAYGDPRDPQHRAYWKIPEVPNYPAR